MRHDEWPDLMSWSRAMDEANRAARATGLRYRVYSVRLPGVWTKWSVCAVPALPGNEFQEKA